MYTAQTNNNGFTEQTNNIPIGLAIRPGLAAGNMIAAGSANKKFKSDLIENNLMNTTIESSKTVYELVGIKSSSYDGLKLIFENPQQESPMDFVESEK